MTHQAHIHMSGRADYVDDCKHPCPACQGYLIRTARRPVDRLLSLFVPVLRYRCQRFSCQWHGNLRVERGAATGAARGHSSASAGARTERGLKRFPLSFTVHMVLAFAGMGLVFVLGTGEPLDLYRTLNLEPPGKEWTTTVSLQDPPAASPSTLDALPASTPTPDLVAR